MAGGVSFSNLNSTIASVSRQSGLVRVGGCLGCGGVMDGD